VNERCPTCNRPWKGQPTNARVCYLCEKPILKHHKYTFDKSQIRHRVCDQPASYVRSEENTVAS
jgi:hypothetical protein